MSTTFTKVSDLINDTENANSTVLRVCFGGEYSNIHLTTQQANISIPAPSLFLEADKEVILREVGDPYSPDLLKIVYKTKGTFPSDLSMTSSVLKYAGVPLSEYDEETADPMSDSICLYLAGSDEENFEKEGDSYIWRCKINKSMNPVLESFSCDFEYKDSEDDSLDYDVLSELELSSTVLIDSVLEQGESALAVVRPIPPFPYFTNGDIVTWNIHGDVGDIDRFKEYNKIVYNENSTKRNESDFYLVPDETELVFSFSWPLPLFGGNDFKSRTFRFVPTVETEYRANDEGLLSLKYYYHTDQFTQPMNEKTYTWGGLILPDDPATPKGVYWVHEHDLINKTSREVAYNLDF